MHRKLPKMLPSVELRKISERKFEEIFSRSAGYQTMKVPQEDDYGIDYIVSLIDSNGCVLSESFTCQLKAVTKTLLGRNENIIFKSFPVKTLNLLSEKPLPSYVFLYDHSNSMIYWEKIERICHFLDANKENWEKQDTVTIYFPQTNILNANKINEIYNEVQNLCKIIRDATPTLNIVDSLKKYADVNVTFGDKSQNINIMPKESGLGGSLKLKAKDVAELQKALKEGLPFDGQVEGGVTEFTFKGEKICEFQVEKVQVQPQNISQSMKFRIPQSTVSIGPFKLIIKKTNFFVKGQTGKEYLPWFIEMNLNINEANKCNIGFKFFKNFASVKNYLEYLRFMDYLQVKKSLEIIVEDDEKKIINFKLSEDFPEIEKWRIEFFENLMLIEEYTSTKFSIPDKVNKDEIEQVYIYSHLLSTGKCKLSSPTTSFEMRGREIKEQIDTIEKVGAELRLDYSYNNIICDGAIAYDAELVIENAILDEKSCALLREINAFEADKLYSLTYKSVEGGKAYILYKPNKNRKPSDMIKDARQRYKNNT